MNNQQTKELAESMNVSVSDLMCFSRLTANGIEDDGVVIDTFLSSDDDIRDNISTVYAQYAMKRMVKIVMKIKTNRKAKDAFTRKVLSDIQEKISIMSVIERTEKYLNGGEK